MAFLVSSISPAKEAGLIKPASRYSANISRSFADANQRHNDAPEEWVCRPFNESAAFNHR
jgi:hypothetical protein